MTFSAVLSFTIDGSRSRLDLPRPDELRVTSQAGSSKSAMLS